MRKMKKIFVMLLAGITFFPLLANAEVKSVKVCDAKTLNANTTTDCTYVDISNYYFFSFQVYCGETTDNSMSIHIDWVGGSGGSSAYMGIPILASGSAMTQLRTTYTTEDAWSVLQTIQPPVSPMGTIRLTENNNDNDIVCTVILNMGR